MTSIPNNRFQNPEQLNSLAGVSASRSLRLADQTVEFITSCQDPNNPSLVFIEFSLAGIVSYMPVIKILEVDGDNSFETNTVVARIVTNDTRSIPLPIATNNGSLNGKILVDFGSAIPNFLAAQKITFKLEMIPQVAIIPGTTVPTTLIYKEYVWEKGVLPTPYTLSYENGVLKVYFQYLGEGNCACQIQCVTPSGVSSDINFCPDDIQAVSVTKELNGDPFTFNVVLRDGVGNTSTLDITTLINVIPISPIVSIEEVSSRRLRAQISINRLNFRGISVSDADYQIIKYTDTPGNYVVWKDWSIRGWDTFMDYNIKEGHTYGYAVRYKGKYGDISEFSPWTSIEANYTQDSTIIVSEDNIQFSDGIWSEAFNHNAHETNSADAYPDMQFAFGPILDEDIYGFLKFPERFKAVHTSVIPKGPNRGKVLVWDLQPVAGIAPTVDPINIWSFQAWSIVDCSTNLTGHKFQNYILPLGPYQATPVPPTVDNETVMVPNLFCAGHTWTKNGDLIVAGGMLWTAAAGQYADKRTFAFNPALPTTVRVTPPGSPYYFSGLSGGHYGAEATGGAGYGAWIEGPNLNIYRYYPTLTASHSITGRLGGDQLIYVFGGSANGYAAQLAANYTVTKVVTSEEPGFINSYEALRITGNVTTGSCGYTGDFYAGTGCFNGPQRVTGSLTDFGNVLDEGFFTYPRMHMLTDGSVFMSSSAPRSSRLLDPDNLPGIWGTGNGYELSPTVYTGFRRYGSDCLYPNINGKENIVVRTAGDLGLKPSLNIYFPYPTWEANSVQFIDAGSNTGSSWVEGPPLNNSKGTSNLVILPDASLFSVGGAYIPTDLYPVPSSEVSLTGPAPLDFNPWIDIDHHNPEGYLENKTNIANNITQTNSDGDVVGYFRFHRYPEVLYPGAASWKTLSTSRSRTNRHYHSTAVLLPDGRVLVAGGENRQLGNGVDYEIFEPHYLRPPKGWTAPLPRPKNVAITTATISPGIEHNAYDLSYNTSYTLVCDAFNPYKISKVVLMSPCSTTHHSDFHQRYRELPIQSISTNCVTFTSPLNDKYWPKGFHMLFVLSNQSIPSEAIWVKF